MSEYVPGVCNIGPAETSRRRRVGYLGIGGALVILAVAVTMDWPPAYRIAVAVPAAFAASGFIQAKLHFCANFGWRGFYNFGNLGSEENVMAAEAARLDRAKALKIGAMSGAIGLAVGVVAVLLPL